MGSNKRKKATHGVSPKSRKTAAKPRTGTIHDFIGMLAGETKKVATIEEMNQAAADGWAGLVKMDDK